MTLYKYGTHSVEFLLLAVIIQLCVCVVVCINIGTLLVVTVARLLFLSLYTCHLNCATGSLQFLCDFFFVVFLFLFFLSDCVLSTVRVWPMLLHAEAVSRLPVN